ncbi:MAG: YcgL domain-containing protein [gamma proteobacterium symbiont of Bathyaustriella thionipta]|nr:YcgL domain-containing protein [gamma proteobacterium symbiont of Bathyaustriella thionipta]MCU7949841.1 YcgL domain-containing protein [gamma proteobacterium symbiont of Bathyaustriella thionipta]MCU7954087.1 YcgL domain-containing protein [gamma proteobacterium symbiont of Bathyaustriella thionipta]MCU7956415.1 YcgL domain-containing protein [gamma proteobacterium symbiont of Bathyaustriella thionipta]MCU7966706.1 YcgL domain-containing protein [gamma proteobacterium symbiont of Bathyaustr
MNTVIYKGSKKQGSYLYIVHKDDFSQVPEVLLKAMGKLEFVMELILNPEKKLAQADVLQVINALKEDGFYLQMPDESEKLALAGKKPVSNPITEL